MRALQALLFLSISSCSTHLFWPDSKAASSHGRPNPPLERIYLDGESDAHVNPWKWVSVPNQRQIRPETRHVLSVPAIDTGFDARRRGLEAIAHAGDRHEDGSWLDTLVRTRNRRRLLRKRRQGQAPRVHVSGSGLEEAVMGEPATITVEVQGWSKVCPVCFLPPRYA